MTRKRWALAGAAAVAAVTVTTAVVVATSRGHPATPASQEPLTTTAKVQKGSLAAMVSLNGTLTYKARADGSPYSVVNQAPGTVTSLPAVGQVVEQGQVIYQVDGNPVVLLYGLTPAYRTLSVGASGADVAELNADLVALGYATVAEIPAGTNTFTPATAAALQKLQATLGVPQTGMLALGQAVFEPVALRVTAVSAILGATMQAGLPLLQGTSTTRVVTLALTTDQQSLVKAGDHVVITLPDSSTTPGVVTSISTVAITSPSSNGRSGSGAGTPMVSVEVQPTDPAATGTLDQLPVQVEVTTQVVEGALSVPVTALVGYTGGGFAVEVVRADSRHELVPVKIGIFDPTGGRVQVEGNLHAGDQVVVPSL